MESSVHAGNRVQRLVARRSVFCLRFMNLTVIFVVKSLPGGNAQGTYEEANKDDNKEKNRYPNILPCECIFCSVGFLTHTEELSFLSVCSHVSMSLWFLSCCVFFFFKFKHS